MSTSSGKVCQRGHRYYKTSDCPTCPVCEQTRTSANIFFVGLPSPARRALERAGIISLSDLAKYGENEILSLHGVGPSTIPKLKHALQKVGLSFRV